MLEPAYHTVESGSTPQALDRLCSTGADALASYRRSDPANRWRVARALRLEFDDLVQRAKRHCAERAAAAGGDLHRPACRETLEAIEAACLDLTAAAVDPRGETRFAAALRRLDALWARWVEEVHTAT